MNIHSISSMQTVSLWCNSLVFALNTHSNLKEIIAADGCSDTTHTGKDCTPDYEDATPLFIQGAL